MRLTRDVLLPVALLAALLTISVYGFWSRHLWQQNLWQPVGAERFLIFLAVACLWFSGWVLFRPRWLAPATCLLTVLYTILSVGLRPLLATAFFLFACFVVGRLIFPAAGGFAGLVPDLLSLLAGMCVVMWAQTLLAHFPVNYPATWLAILGVPLLIRPRTTRACLARMRGLFGPADLAGRRDYLMLSLALLPLMAHWLVVLKPEVATDALSMHLVVPAYVANHHLWSFDFRRLAWAVMPMGGVWCYTVTYQLGGEFAARLLNLALLGVICALVYAGARRWAGRPSAFLLVALLASTPVVQLVTGSLFVETFHGVLLPAALFALLQYRDTGYNPALAIAALLLGSAMGVKLVSLPFAVPLGVLLLWESQRLWSRGNRLWLPVCILILLTLAPIPYLYAWITTGDPVFPFANTIFKSPYFARVMFPDPRFAEALTWRTPFDMTFETHRYWEGQDGSLGFQFLLLVPLVLVAMRKQWNSAEWTVTAIALGGTFLGLVMRPYVRYLYPASVLLTLSFALVFRKDGPLELRRWLWGVGLGCLAMNLWFLPSSSFYHKMFCLPPFDRNAVHQYLEREAPVRLLVDRLNHDYPGEDVLFLENMDIAGLGGEVWSNGWHSYLFMQRVEKLRDGVDALRLMRELGVRHFVYPDPAGGVPVRDSELRSLVTHFTRQEATAGGFRMASLRPEFTGPDGLERAMAEDRPPDAMGAGRYDDFDARIQFLGHWSHDPQFPAARNSSVTYCDVPEASFRFIFRGTSISWVYTKALNRGMAEVLVDGRSLGQVDLYSPDARWQSHSDFRGLRAGEHVFEVRILNGKNPQSSGNYIDVDELTVE